MLCITRTIHWGGIGEGRGQNTVVAQNTISLKLATITYKLHKREKTLPGHHS